MFHRYFLLLSLSVYVSIEAKQVCYGDLGCFTDDWPFSFSVQRPFNALPDKPEKINTKFTLYTRSDRTVGKRITYDYFGDYSSAKPTKFIVHGFCDLALKTWVLDMKFALLHSEDMNVITVDWSGGNCPFYTQATANTRVVGAEIAKLINTMISTAGAKAADFHIIGHSLGAHISGYAGERVNGLGRISGLDPAGPYFEYLPANATLDASDAVFVDAMHTDGTANLLLGLGLMEREGHVDFYPNGGKDQPKCPATSLKILGAIFGAVMLSTDFIEGK
jgi:pimeloyl-ACP methyl ester carboxylesterase